VVTVTSVVPPPEAGAVTVITVAETDLMVAAIVPKFTAVAPENPEPVTVIVVPPLVGPVFGLTRVTTTPLGGAVVVVVVLLGVVVVVVVVTGGDEVPLAWVVVVVVVGVEPPPRSALYAASEFG
jgi:hypothetical protein